MGQGRVAEQAETDLVTLLRRAGVARGDPVGLAVAPGGGLGVAVAAGGWWVPPRGGGPAVADLAAADDVIRPRWVVWSGQAASVLAAAGLRLATCWDIAAVHRLLFGGWRADPGWAWAHLRGLAPETVPAAGPPDLFSEAGELPETGEPGDPVGPGGHLLPEWVREAVRGGWGAGSPARLARWASLGHEAAALQRAAVDRLPDRPMAAATARSESTAELLCAELSADGLPMDRETAEQVLTAFIGPRPRGEPEAAAMRAARDAEVLRHAPPGAADLRSPVQVRSLLARAGVRVPDTRAWRLEPYRDTHPLVAALLEWRKAERIATTYGYAWLDEHLGADGRLRGTWTGSDGAAGRMTASGGLHNMPSAMRRAVVAEPGHVFVRADLGQIEPRVLAAVSGDTALAAATRADDLYKPVADQLGVDRPTAKVAMIAAMYGQTTGHGGQALRRMRAAYPVAMAYLDAADRSARGRRDLRTYGGRLIVLSGGAGQAPDTAARAAARGRYGRNALIQGAAAELFKMWAVTVRARCGPLDASIVLCLHDELLVHVPAPHAAAVSQLVGDCLRETARRWAPGGQARFTADISVVRSWSDANRRLPAPSSSRVCQDGHVDTEDLRLAVYRSFAGSGRVPPASELAKQLTCDVSEVTRGLRTLARRRHLAVDARGEIAMAHPFSAVPLGFSVMGGRTLWWGGCAWDSFALPHLLTGEGEMLVATRCPACGRPHAWNAGTERPPDGSQVAHFLIPAAHMWDDVVHTCRNQRIFCSGDCVGDWLRATGAERGYVMDLATLWRLAAHWYDGRLNRGYVRREPSEAVNYLRSVGLSGPFWGL
ncbi:MAG: hypothetical protein JOY82_09170 [Streptosporangiaceae bacterium]|nr:hypothetical protein [Streptosporangiaceae bacterium]MBV9854683.1 hypothetical protein [Streptosporangiaceae bacterium]